MKKLCVFCGSKSGNSKYVEEAKLLGETLAKNKIGLVYGGASVGLMGAVADAVLENKGEVWGVMPKSLIDMEVAHKGLANFFKVSSMHDRKQKMYDLSDGFLAIPGGLGTLDELFEITTWAQLKHHGKPIWVLNQDGFYDDLLRHIKRASSEGFVSKADSGLIKEVKTIDEWFDDWQKRI